MLTKHDHLNTLLGLRQFTNHKNKNKNIQYKLKCKNKATKKLQTKIKNT